MARIVTLQLLVEADDDTAAANLIDRALQPLMQQYVPDSRLIDFRLYGIGIDTLQPYVSRVDPATDAAVASKTRCTMGLCFPTMQMALPIGRTFAMAHDPTGEAQREGNDRLYVEVFAHPEPDFPVGAPGSIDVHLNRTHEGVIVDLYAAGTNRCIGTTCAEFSDASAAQVEEHDLDPAPRPPTLDSLHANHRGLGPHS